MENAMLKPLLGAAALALAACAAAPVETASVETEVEASAKLAAVEAAVADPTRIEEHLERDAGRKPADVLAFAGVEPGDKVAELAAGGGYYTALLSRIVGAEGHVYAVDPSLIFEAFPPAKEGFPKYIAADPRENVSYSVQRLDALKLEEPLDAVFMVLYYHDTIWTGEDRAAMNKAIYDALKPGGVYLVLDHHALAGAPDSVTQDLHRMNAAIVKPEVIAAGFKLKAESDLFRNPGDPRDTSVFDAAWRGKTDRFVYLFEKPA